MNEKSRWPSLSLLLMAGLAACFTVQQIVIVHFEKPYDAYLALSGYGMKSGHLWELLTYQCFHQGSNLAPPDFAAPWEWVIYQAFHQGWAHLAVNLLGLWFLARTVEGRLGPKRFLYLYLGAVLAGAVLQGAVALAGFWLPESLESLAASLRDRFGGPVAGASVGLCGVLTVWCLAEPTRTVRLFGVIPIKAAPLWGIALSVAVVLVIFRTDPSLAHLAHLGGLAFGLAFLQPGRQPAAEPSRAVA